MDRFDKTGNAREISKNLIIEDPELPRNWTGTHKIEDRDLPQDPRFRMRGEETKVRMAERAQLEPITLVASLAVSIVETILSAPKGLT